MAAPQALERACRPLGSGPYPPSERGGDHDPQNLRTLCQPCHKQQTRRLVNRRAVRRQKSA
ncbi:MAG: HNH endonuclease [Meiothermus silvanus]|nr:HNH endonuclease [Allomeiothermus silvanus]